MQESSSLEEKKENWLRSMLGKLMISDRGFYKSIFALGLPTMLQGFINMGVNMMDSMMLGSYGELQLSAASLANEYISIFQIICFGLGGGAMVLTAQYWGAKDTLSIKKITALMFKTALMISMAFLLSVAVGAKQILRIYTTEEEVITKGMIYFEISLITFPLMAINLTLSTILQSVRQTKVPLITSIIAFFVNIFFNWVFIFGNLGAPEMQIGGAALGTVMARLTEACVTGIYFFGIDKRIGFRLKDLWLSGRGYYRLYLKYSIPVLISDALLAMGNSAVAVIMGHIGAAFVAANSIMTQMVRITTVVNQGLSKAGCVVVGNSLGKGDVEGGYRQAVTFTSLSVLIGIFAAGIVKVLTGSLISVFNVSGETVSIAYQLADAIAIMVIFQTMQTMLTKGVLRGGGDTAFIMVADALFMWLCSIPLGYLVGLQLGGSAFWIYIALRVDYIIKSVWCCKRLKNRKWIHQVDGRK